MTHPVYMNRTKLVYEEARLERERTILLGKIRSLAKAANDAWKDPNRVSDEAGGTLHEEMSEVQADLAENNRRISDLQVFLATKGR